jgi:outer membrane protein assembly factor BamB
MDVRRWSLVVLLALVTGAVFEPFGGSSNLCLAQGNKSGKARKPARKTTPRRGPAGKSATVDVGDASWPQFLGPDRNNQSTETGLLKKWPQAGPKLLTTIRGLGIGFSNVAIDDGVVYTMGNQGERELVVALSLETGEKVWSYPNGAAYHNGFGDGPRGTPTLDGDVLYALGANGDLCCLKRESGEEVWKKSLVAEFGTAIPSWGICESVLIDGDRLICTPGGREATMVALDKNTGAIVWKGVTPQQEGPAYASIIAVEDEGVKQYVNYTATGVIGINAEGGEFLWRDDSSSNGTANCAAPVFADGFVFTASGYGKGGSAVELKVVDGKPTAQFQYHTNELKVHHGGLVLHEGYIYGSNDPGILTCVELKSGNKKWQNRSIGKGSLTYADGCLYLRSEQGPMALIQATPAAYKELGRFEPKDRSSSPAWTYPVVCGGKLFLRDQDLLQVYDLTGR